MKKMYKNAFIGKITFLFVCALYMLQPANAQTVVINSGTPGTPQYNAGPIYRSAATSAYDASRYAYLYTADELNAVGITPGAIINILGWAKANNAVTNGGAQFRIYMKNSSATTYGLASESWTNLSNGAILVYENLNQNIPATMAPDYITFPLAVPFTYTGGSLEILTEWDINQVTGTATSGTFQWLWSTVVDRIYGTGQTVLANAGTLSATSNSISDINDRRPFLQITFTPGGPCTDPPVPGTITATNLNVCMNTPFGLTYTGGTSGIGQTIQWQVSTDGGTTWADIPGANSPLLNTQQAVTSTYRVNVTCGASTVAATPVTINSPIAVQGTFTINQLAPPSATNFQSFNDAYDYMRCGIGDHVVFNVLNGPYNEQLIMEEIPGAGPGATITFNGNNQIIQFNSTNTNERAVIKLNGTDYITFNDLIVIANGTSTSEYGYGFHLLNDPNTVAINGCTINLNTTSTSANYAGIVVSASHTSATTTGSVLADDLFFINNTINGGNYGITLVGSSTEANRNCVIVGNSINDFNAYGIYVMGSFNVLIEGNTIQRPLRVTTTASNGIYFTGLSVAATVAKNRIFNSHGADNNSTGTFTGIFFTGVDAFSGLENRVENNVIYNLNGSGNMVGIQNTGSDNIQIYHNTIVLDGNAPASTTTHYTRGFYQTTEAGGIDFKNNLISINRGGPGEKHGMYFNTATSLILSNNNNIFIAPGVANAYIGRANATNYATLAGWQAGATQDANSVSIDPIFAGAAGGNLLPTNASMNDLGVPLGVLTDIMNINRSATTPDIGAYEFTPLPCVAPPTPGTVLITPNDVCEGTLVSLSGLGNSTGLSQTYQWESSPTNSAPWTIVSPVLTNSTFAVNATTSLYYRLAVTCNGNTQYSPGALLQVNPSLPAATYTINGLQPTGGGNYNSFADAYQALSCGIAGHIIFDVNPAGGPYLEQLIMDPVLYSAVDRTVTFRGNGAVIRYEPTVNNQRAVIKLRGADHIIFENLVVDVSGAGATYGFGFQLTQDADSNVIRGCEIINNTTSTSTNFAGIVISASETSATTTGATKCDGNLIENNTITGGYYGITLTGSAADRVMNNRFLNNKISEYYTYGIYLNIVGATLVEKNDFSRPSRSTVNTHYGIYGSGSSQGVNISKNIIHNPFGGNLTTTNDFFGIYLTGFDGASGGLENVISNNLIHSVNGEGDYTGLYNTSSDNALYYHNTVVLENLASNSNLTTRGFYQTTSASGIELRNNIFYIDRRGTGVQHVVYFNTAASQITADRNVYHITPGNEHYIGRAGATNHANLFAWQAATGMDANSQAINPEFAGLLIDDYTPTLGAIDNMGTPVGITTDIFDVARNATTPDVGAIEFTVPPCTVPPTTGTTEVSPNTGICIGTEVLLNLNGHSAGAGQTYVWQRATSAAGPWTDISPVLNSPVYLTTITAASFFRAVVTCSGNSVTSPVASVTLNSYLPEGYYTIDPSGPATLPNFQSFGAAVDAIQCGIGGEVKFFVVPGTYNEQIRIGRVGGTGHGSRVIFLSQNGDPTSVILTNDASASPLGSYTVKLDSAEFITFKNMTIRGTGNGAARAVEFAGSVKHDSIYNCIITVPNVTSTSTNVAGIWGTDLSDADSLYIYNNTITGGYAGIALDGVSTTVLINHLAIDSNTVSDFYQYGIYTGFNKRLRATANLVNMTAPLNTTAYAMYNTNADSGLVVSYNRVNINNTTTTSYGIYFTGCDASSVQPGKVYGNKVIALNNNSGNLYGMYHTASVNIGRANNVLNVATSGTTAYASYSTGGNGGYYWNNSIRNSSTASTSTTNIAAYFTQTTSGGNGPIDVRNNIFHHNAGGIALGIGNVNHVATDYNFIYTSGATLVRRGTVNHNTLEAWRNDAFWDVNSMVYPPVYSDPIELTPDINAPDVWAMHGRGTQIEGNDIDINGNPRPTTLTAGVPDMGAYEFEPTSLPTVLTAIPANPAPGITQTFFYGTDTVTKITYAAGSTVPGNVELRRYSGVIPPNLAPGQPSTYFYTDADITGSQPSDIKVEQYYIDPWQGFIPNQVFIKLGRTDDANAWQVNAASTVDEILNVFRDENLSFLDKFTGLMDGTTPTDPPTILPPADSSNRGTHFWVGYGHHQGFEGANGQDMILYFSAEQAANVVVRINGTSYAREYQVPANSVITSQLIPKTGVFDARLLIDGKSTKGISITSDVPIVAYAHIYASTTSEASLLLPIGTYGYEYTALTTVQNYATNTYSWAYVIAAHDSTRIEITPSNPTLSGRPANTPFVVNLNKGEVYQVLGALLAPGSSDGHDMTGTFFKSIPNDNGRCLPMAVFSGSSRTNIGCGTSTPTASGDNILEQNFPYSAWGKKYLIAPTSNSSSASSFHTNIYRVAVRDPATNVTVNGVPLTGLRNNFYYQFESNTPDVIEADQPIIVAQIMSSSGSCPNTGGGGDPGMIYVSPVEQGIKNIGLYRNTQSAITVQYLTMVVPTDGLSSLLIDNAANAWDHTYPHSEPGYSVVVKRWSPATNAQVLVSCDSAYTAITYGLGSVESYGYNAGTLVRNLNSRPGITNVLGDGSLSPYTCVNAPFTISTLISVKPTTINWTLSNVPGLSPNADVFENDPTPVDSTIISGTMYYQYNLPGTFTVSQVGQFVVPIYITHPDIEGCNNRLEISLELNVRPSPAADFSVDFTGCLGDVTSFTGITSANGIPITDWHWNFGNGDTSIIDSHTLTYGAPGIYDVTFTIITEDGCIGDSTLPVEVRDRPTLTVVDDTLGVCGGSTATFMIENPDPALTYSWYDSPTGGVLLHVGTTFSTSSATNTSYWVEAAFGDCISTERVEVWLEVGNTLSVSLVQPEFILCNAGDVTFEVLNPITGATYTWYDAPTGGNVVHTGTSFTIPNASASVTYYVEGQSGTCVPDNRTPATITVVPLDAVVLVEDTIALCGTGDATFEISNPDPGVTYNWYDTPTGGTPLHTGSSYTVTGITGDMEFWVEAAAGTCVSIPRTQAVVLFAVSLSAPVVTVTEEGQDYVTFSWNAVPLAASYSVSLDNGATWEVPSSGASGLTHTVSGLTPDQSVTIIVRAELGTACASENSAAVTGTARSSEVFIPNSFTPNGDGRNDILQVYGNSVQSLRFMVFNQWGEKLTESTNPANVWDGRHRGKLQPSGVYIYVAQITLRDGTVLNRKGSINLIR